MLSLSSKPERKLTTSSMKKQRLSRQPMKLLSSLLSLNLRKRKMGPSNLP